MKLSALRLKDKAIFNKYLKLSSRQLSAYAFINIYIWKVLFRIEWAIIKKSLCVFFRDNGGCFAYLSPFTDEMKADVVGEVFCIMDNYNKNKEISRIENIEAKDIEFYRRLGYVCREKFPEYLYQRTDLARLRGNRFKSKRSACNYFTKHYQFDYIPFSLKYKDDCLNLYQLWKDSRSVYKDPVYQGMLLDSHAALEILLDNYRCLDIAGRVITIDGKVRAFTFGYELNDDTFCVLYEITDLSYKGISQFIFSNFCAELKSYQYINIMDDSGLENLKETKLSYHPLRLIPNFVATRPRPDR